MKLTPRETIALAPFLDRLHPDDVESIVGQFRRIAVATRDLYRLGKTVSTSVPGDAEWSDLRMDLFRAGVIVARIRDRDVSDDDAASYSQVYVRATELVRRAYLLKDGRCDALDQLDTLEATRADDPVAVW